MNLMLADISIITRQWQVCASYLEKLFVHIATQITKESKTYKVHKSFINNIVQSKNHAKQQLAINVRHKKQANLDSCLIYTNIFGCKSVKQQRKKIVFKESQQYLK